MRWLVLCITLAAIFSPISAKAQCTLVSNGETRPEGRMIYNADYDVHQVCIDGQWTAVEPIGCAAGDGCVPDPCVGSPSAGTTCADGSIYTGLSPDGNVPMFTTPADAPSLIAWNNGNSSPLSQVDTTMVNCVGPTPGAQASCQTGEANTALLVSEDSDSGVGGIQPHLAAAYCEGLSVHGHSDWYLPAQDELDVLYDNKNAGDLNGTFDESATFPNDYYWSSSENQSSQAKVQRFSNGDQFQYPKSTALVVRCVRRGS